jgi:two-component system sensor histidine kinase KdpD
MGSGVWGIALAAVEVIAAVAAATGLVAILDPIAPIAGLSVIYLLAVVLIAVRRGQAAALAAAALGVTTMNFVFIEPRYQLAIADRGNVVALAVFLVAGLVVGRLAATARDRAAEAERRARQAAAREREAGMLAGAASAVLATERLDAQLASLAASVESSSGSAVRVGLSSAPAAVAGEIAVPLPTDTRPGWVYGDPDASLDRESLERIARPLAGLIDIAVERERFGTRTAEAEAARRADVAKTALLHAISHDLRSPLTAIATAAAGLRPRDLPEDDRAALLATIDTEAGRLAGLVDDLLDLSRIEAGAVNPRTDWCDVGDVVAGALASVRRRYEERPIELDLGGPLPLVEADAAQLERVFSNLIDNALKFSPSDAPVRVSATAAGDRVVVRVTDRGRGIAPSRRASVFEPFGRGDESGKGSGLGLAICRGFVEANGGEIQLQSNSGRGSTFAVSFPAAAQPSPVP